MLMTKIRYKLLKISFFLVNLIFVQYRTFHKKRTKKKIKCNFYFEASEYSLMSKLTNFVIWNDFNSLYYAGNKNLLIWDQDTNFKLGAYIT